MNPTGHPNYVTEVQPTEKFKEYDIMKNNAI